MHARAAVAEEAGQRRDAAEVGDRRDAAEHEREPDRVVREQRDRERRDVHHHHVAGVLRPGEPGDQEREADLHEQHEEAGEQHPGEVDRDAEVPGLGRERVQAGLRDGHAVAGRPGGAEIVRQSAGGGAGGVAAVMAPHGTGNHQRKERERAHEDHLLRCRHKAPDLRLRTGVNRNEARVDGRLSRGERISVLLRACYDPVTR